MEKAIEWVKNHKPHTAVIVIVVVAVIAVLIAAASGAFTQQDKTKDAIENGDETLKGDAGTGMVATNSVAPGTGNVSAGTSVFAMIVLEKPLSRVYPELDIVATPTGKPVAMVHCNNCTSDLNAWVGLFGEFAEMMGMKVDPNTLYGSLYRKALEGDKGCAGMLAYNFFSGITWDWTRGVRSSCARLRPR